VEPRNLPVVVNPHGGPWARDTWAYDPYAQFLANRGYAVLQPNFRGSTGFGKAFLNAGNREWGTGYMQHDITDGVRYLIEEGIADPDRIAIFGGPTAGTPRWRASPSRPTCTQRPSRTWRRRA
jgi:dipeptidyl aminopeptidase/acylaminoacyl peptidase